MSQEQREEAIYRTIIDLPVHNEQSSKYLIYLLYFFYRENTI